ncbi:MAG TPA: HAMP domain-containing sensor histidine kinase [Candidatus Hydrogenedentes bacterium]|nr:HAMP domain-containing sensor histidine kinase [Candidatus Hydrogenedentota bacterium]
MTQQKVDLNTPDGMGRLAALYRYAQVGRCVNGVAHDINNLLGAVLAYTELVQLEPGLTENGQRMLDNVLEAAEKCASLVSALTAIARPERESQDMVDLGALLREMSLLRDYAFRNGRISYELILPESTPSALVDGPKLRWIILYLLLNVEDAVADAEAGARIIRVELSSGSGGFDISVWNPQVTDLDPETVFLPLNTSRNTGLGVGLFLARDLAERIGGTLTLDPRKGFTVHLPGVSSG